MSEVRAVVVAVALGVLLVVIGCLLFTGSRTVFAHLCASLGITAVGVVWMIDNQSVEGKILLRVVPHHGLTVADLPSLALFIIAFVLAFCYRAR